ncbi:MAG: 6-pyruvoyl-tetrahydropterin synthase-related protein [Candidatus Levyibacteriota bacterium]
MFKKFLPVIFIALLVIPVLELFHPGLPVTHDGQDHVARIANFYQNLAEGNIIPRWASNLNWGYGHPILMFLYPLPSYMASFFHAVGFSLVDSLKLVFAISFILSGLSMYLWARTVWGKEAGVAAAILYTYAPYRFVDLYVRGAIGEHVAFIFPPLVLYFFYKLSKKTDFIYIAGGALSLAGFILAHNAISIMFLPIIILYGLYLLWQNKLNKYFMFSSLSLVFLGFGLSAFFWGPAYFEGKYTLRDIVTSGEFTSRFVQFKDLLWGEWNYGISGQFTVQVGILHWVIVALSIALLFIKKQKKNLIINAALIGILGATLFLMTEPSRPVWDTISVLQKFQFPWRLLSVVVFCTAVLGALVISSLAKKYKTIGVILIIFFSLLLNKNYWHASSYVEKPEEFYSGIYDGTTDTGESAPVWSVRFMEKEPKAEIEIISGEASATVLERKVTRHSYEVTAGDKVRLRENTLYFPGWMVLISGKPTDIEFQDENNRGVMTFGVPAGKYRIDVIFSETKLRNAANMISAFSMLCILILMRIGYRRKKHDTKN